MLPHIHSAADLITSHASTRDGFLKQALTKTRKATPYIQEANELAAVLEATEDVDGLSHHAGKSIRSALYAAAGFSDKARSRMTESELETALAEVLQSIRKATPNSWRREIVYRFLLTRGDTLGGSMRNVTGAAGGAQLSRAIVTALEALDLQPTIARAPKNAEKVVSLEWTNRLLLFDKKPAFIGNNIDAILLDTGMVSLKALLETPENYLACGELKGGIDPAGADEHWKTAQSAFDRIRDRFLQRNLVVPSLFFVGAAIEAAMANQIFARLEDGRLMYAANLTVPQQVAELANWLVSL